MSWQDHYRHGTFVIWPPDPLRMGVDTLREQYDPDSHAICEAHITLTQPLLAEPTAENLLRISECIQSFESFDIRYGPIELLGERVVVFAIEPKQEILDLREALHGTGLFNLDMPFTKGFVPHMTISECGIDRVGEVLRRLNETHAPGSFSCPSVTWIVPDSNFRFQIRQTFDLAR